MSFSEKYPAELVNPEHIEFLKEIQNNPELLLLTHQRVALTNAITWMKRLYAIQQRRLRTLEKQNAKASDQAVS